MIPSVVLWLIVLVLALVWSGQKGQIRTLLIALTLVAVRSLAGVLIEYNANPQFWWRDFYMRFD